MCPEPVLAKRSDLYKEWTETPPFSFDSNLEQLEDRLVAAGLVRVVLPRQLVVVALHLNRGGVGARDQLQDCIVVDGFACMRVRQPLQFSRLNLHLVCHFTKTGSKQTQGRSGKEQLDFRTELNVVLCSRRTKARRSNG